MAVNMKPLPLTPKIEAVARRVIWFEEPCQALQRPYRFLTYAITSGSTEDMVIIQKYMSDDDLREALANALPGIFTEQSWEYWNR
jgi:hypothetical protein